MAYLIISLDTELQWGHILYPNLPMAKILHNNEKGAANSINCILDLFAKYRVGATWAIVGRIFKDHPEIIERILSSPIKQEIGYHSFSHLVIPDCSHKIADSQISRGVDLAKDFGITFKSFVFPENKIGHLDLLKRYGFKIYRGANHNRKCTNKSFHIKVSNYCINKIFPPGVTPLQKEGIWELPSSMAFYDPEVRCTLGLRANLGIRRTVQLDGVFHIYLHPEDLLLDRTLITTLENVLLFASNEREDNRLKVITMGQLYDILNQDS